MAISISRSEAIEKVAEYYKQWLLGAGKPRELVRPKDHFESHPERNYNLKNKQYIKFLQHEKQTFGINLGWTDDATNETGNKVARWFFVRSGQGDGPIKYGETIAVGNGGSPSFLHYAHRDYGINLDWSQTPVFEWKLLGGKIGDPVYTQELVAIYNEKPTAGGECLIHFNRTVGGDIGWPSSKTVEEVLGDKLAEELKKAVGEAVKQLGTEALKALMSKL
jgi:hypothetical protein